jgi:magnesium chelatase family protein
MRINLPLIESIRVVHLGEDITMIKIQSAVLTECQSQIVLIEAAAVKGYHGLQYIGQMGDICRHGRQRTLATLESIGICQPARRYVISLTPADRELDGTQLDMAFAVAFAILFQAVDCKWDLTQSIFMGELQLDGSFQPFRGAVPLALEAKKQGANRIVTDPITATTIAQIPGSHFEHLEILSAPTIKHLIAWLAGRGELHPAARSRNGHLARACRESGSCSVANFADMVLAPEQITLAAAISLGRHHSLISGPPGSGKSMFASRLRSAMPPPDEQKHLEILMIQSVGAIGYDLLPGILDNVPFRSPHHSSSMQAVSGTLHRPGDIALAHGGLLFLDELPEFRRDVLEGLREPLELKYINVSRAQGKVTWPADFVLVATMNPCPCGYFGDQEKSCQCSMAQILNYRKRISGPILDRIDIKFTMDRIHQSDLLLPTNRTNPQQVIEALVKKGMKRREERLSKLPMLNSGGTGDLSFVAGQSVEKFMKMLLDVLPKGFSQRGTLKLIRLARSLADLDDSASIEGPHLARALSWQSESHFLKAYGLSG